MGMPWVEFSTRLDEIESATGRLEKTALCSELLAKCGTDDISAAAHMLCGELMPARFGLELGIDSALVSMALRSLGGKPDTADLGLSARMCAGGGCGGAGVLGVHDRLVRLSALHGHGSRAKKIEEVARLVSDLGDGSKWAVRVMLGRMRSGVSTATVLKALADTFGARDSAVESAFNACSDIGRVASGLKSHGKSLAIEAEPMSPVRPMLAGRSDTVDPAGDGLHIEEKLDGERLQIHVSGGKSAVFSRSGEDITAKYPDVAEAALSVVNPIIMEGEAVAVDGGKMLPFQELLHRAGDSPESIPVRVYLFDMLYAGGRSLLGETYSARREALHRHMPRCEPFEVVPSVSTGDVGTLLDEALAGGAEGLMLKYADSTYRAGKRGGGWLKLKREYLDGGETFDLVVLGALRGRGKRAGVYGAFVMGARSGGSLVGVCKVGTGFTEDDLSRLYSELSPGELTEPPSGVHTDAPADVYFEPSMVLEVQSYEVSRNGKAGYGLRFPVFKGRRPDRDAANATGLAEVAEAYSRQVKRTG